MLLNKILAATIIIVFTYLTLKALGFFDVEEGFYPWWRQRVPWWNRSYRGWWNWQFMANDAYYRPNFYSYYAYY